MVTLQSVKEEIANNLLGQLDHILESDDDLALENWLASLTEEQIMILEQETYWQGVRRRAGEVADVVKGIPGDIAQTGRDIKTAIDKEGVGGLAGRVYQDVKQNPLDYIPGVASVKAGYDYATGKISGKEAATSAVLGAVGAGKLAKGVSKAGQAAANIVKGAGKAVVPGATGKVAATAAPKTASDLAKNYAQRTAAMDASRGAVKSGPGVRVPGARTPQSMSGSARPAPGTTAGGGGIPADAGRQITKAPGTAVVPATPARPQVPASTAVRQAPTPVKTPTAAKPGISGTDVAKAVAAGGALGAAARTYTDSGAAASPAATAAKSPAMTAPATPATKPSGTPSTAQRPSPAARPSAQARSRPVSPSKPPMPRQSFGFKGTATSTAGKNLSAGQITNRALGGVYEEASVEDFKMHVHRIMERTR